MIDVFRRALSDFLHHKYLHGICLATIALSVFIISAFGLFLINTGEVMDAWQKGIRVIAYLRPGIPVKEREVLVQTIRKFPEVAEVDYVSADAALAWLKNEVGRQSTLLEGLSENPLPESMEIRLKEGFQTVASIDALAGRIRKQTQVSEVEYAQKWVHRFNGIYELFRLTGLALISLIFLAIMMIVANTFRLILYSRSAEIRITRIIGASGMFIKLPFYIEGIMLGLLGGAIGLAILYGTFSATVPRLSPTGLLPFYQIRFLPADLTGMILLTSMLVGLLGCQFSIRRLDI